MENNKETSKDMLIQQLRAVLEEYLLSEFQLNLAVMFINSKVASDKHARLRRWLLNKINNKLPDVENFQLGCPEVIPGLTQRPLWEPSQFDFVRNLIENFEEIKAELLNLRVTTGFQPYKSLGKSEVQADDGIGYKAHEGGDWNVFYLFLHDIEFTENCKKCPKTTDLIKNTVDRNYKHAFFSALTPGTHIKAHNGPTNKKLRLHIPLMNCEGAYFRVGDKKWAIEEGVPFIFDDSFEHEAWHDGDKTRIHLIIDFWHPELSNSEVKFFSMLQNSKLRKGKRLLKEVLKENNDNYFEVLEKSKETLKNNDWWIG